MANPISIINDDYVFDSSRRIYVARDLLLKDERVIRATKKVLSSGKYKPNEIPYKLLNALQDERFLIPGDHVDVRTLSGIESLFQELELPGNLPRQNQRLRSRIMTSEECADISKWAGKNDSKLYDSMMNAFWELVYNPATHTYQLADSFPEEEPRFDDVQEADLNGESYEGFWTGVREIVEVQS